MNKQIVRYVLGWVLALEAGFMLLPALTAAIYGEPEGIWFLVIAFFAALIGIPSIRRKPEGGLAITPKTGYLVTALSWIVMSLVGALPFYYSRCIPSYVDALFEMVSGFTTTGASIVNDVEALPHCMNLWRCLSHWMGGMGVLVFLLMVLQMAGGTNINLMRAESPGPSVGKITPKMRSTARILYIVYFFMTVLHFLLLVLGKMPVFDAICTACGTAGTGGFGIKGDSLASYSPYIQWVTAIFMILFGVNFNLYVFLLFRKWKQALRMEEVWCYFAVIGGAVLLILPGLLRYFDSFGAALRHAVFQVASIITTTGFATANFDVWPQASRVILVMLMFVGACAGSTGGGLKISRLMIGFKSVCKELHTYVYPKSVRKVTVDGVPVESDVMRGISVYFVTFFLLFSASLLLVSLEGHDLVTTFTAVSATINNIGPGLASVGPTRNFALFSDFSKIVMIFDMLIGRLEIFPMLLLFYPPCWKGVLKKQPPQTRFKF